MGSVFANARRVLVWLGVDSNSKAEDTFTLICKTNVYFERSLLASGRKYRRIPPLQKPYPICVNKNKWSGVANLFAFSWFRRVWTVQEAAAAGKYRMY